MLKETAAEEPTKLIQTYCVWVEQVNQTMLEVQAFDADEAREKGYAKWRRDFAHSRVSDVKPRG